jgi:hypothetical protein
MKEDDVLEVVEEIEGMAKVGEVVRVISVHENDYRVKTVHGEIMNMQPTSTHLKASTKKWPGEKNEAEIETFRAARKKAREATKKITAENEDKKTDPAV